eukprot:7554443-Prorocentrum_lima.AAC.1
MSPPVLLSAHPSIHVSMCLDSTACEFLGHSSNNAWPGGSLSASARALPQRACAWPGEPQRVSAGRAPARLRVARGSISASARALPQRACAWPDGAS